MAASAARALAAAAVRAFDAFAARVVHPSGGNDSLPDGTALEARRGAVPVKNAGLTLAGDQDARCVLVASDAGGGEDAQDLLVWLRDSAGLGCAAAAACDVCLAGRLRGVHDLAAQYVVDGLASLQLAEAAASKVRGALGALPPSAGAPSPASPSPRSRRRCRRRRAARSACATPAVAPPASAVSPAAFARRRHRRRRRRRRSVRTTPPAPPSAARDVEAATAGVEPPTPAAPGSPTAGSHLVSSASHTGRVTEPNPPAFSDALSPSQPLTASRFVTLVSESNLLSVREGESLRCRAGLSTLPPGAANIPDAGNLTAGSPCPGSLTAGSLVSSYSSPAPLGRGGLKPDAVSQPALAETLLTTLGASAPASEVTTSGRPLSLVSSGSPTAGSSYPGSLTAGSSYPGSLTAGSSYPGSLTAGSSYPGSVTAGSLVPFSVSGLVAGVGSAGGGVASAPPLGSVGV